jgi:hypothetical protein
MSFLVAAVLRAVHMLLKVVIYLACIACVTVVGGMSGRAAADMPASARAPQGVRAVTDDAARTSQCAQDTQLPEDESSAPDNGPPDSTSEEDDQNDAADGDPLALIERQATHVLQLPLVCRQHSVAQNVAARDHSSLEPRPPRA